MKYLPSFKNALFCILTFANVGLATFFAANEMYQQSIFSGVTALLCLGVWYKQLDNKDSEE